MTRESLALLRELKMERRICNGWWRSKRRVKTKRVSSTFGLDCIAVNAKPLARVVMEKFTAGQNLVKMRQHLRFNGVNVQYARRRPNQVQEAGV